MSLPVFTPQGVLNVSGLVSESDQISGIAFTEDRSLLFLAADEEGQVQVFRRDGDSLRYDAVKPINVLPAGDPESTEADLESLAVDGHWLYALGSHSAKRNKIDAKRTRAENRQRLFEKDKEKGRRLLVRIRLDSILSPMPEIERGSLWSRIKADPLLEPFSHIPGKENGIDIEGLAVTDHRLLAGFRAPVLRGGFAVLIDTKFAEASPAGLLFLDLGGAGIRDLAAVTTGAFLVLCGPAGDVAGSYVLKLWNGADRIPGKDGPPPGLLVDLGIIPPPPAWPDAKAEGVTVFQLTEDGADIVVVYDGAERGAPTLFHVRWPQ